MEGRNLSLRGAVSMEAFYYWTTFAVFAVLGLAIGSFLNVVIYRLPRGMNLAKPASHCTSCDHKLAWYDNIPVFSYLFLRGRCRYCGAKVTPRYLVVEVSNCILWCLAVYFFYSRGIVFTAVCALALSVLLAMAFCDAENLFLPDSLQIALLLCAIVGLFFDPQNDWTAKLWGLLVGGGSFLFFYLLSFVLFRREGLGFGDVKLMAIAGLLLGWKGITVSILVGILCALVGVVVRKLTVRRAGTLEESDEFAFAPYLVAGIMFSMFFGDMLIDGYLAFLM